MCARETAQRESGRESGWAWVLVGGVRGNPEENEILTKTIIFEYDQGFSRVFRKCQ